MADVLSLITAAVATVQKLKEVAQKMKDADTRNLVADLNMTLADLKLQFADLQEENIRLKGELRKAHESEELRGKLAVKDGLYYLNQPIAGRPDGPYCTRCFDVEGKLVLVVAFTGAFREFGKYNCPNCKAHY
jgi:hypothetical protein